MERINYVNEYLKEKFGERTLKICIDGNFTCPNRDGKCGYGGCIFCSEKGSGEHIKSQYNSSTNLNIPSSNFDITDDIKSPNTTFIENTIDSITKQVNTYFSTYRAQRANKFILYFQNFTNTYDSIENLKARYDAALIDKRIVGLSIATRPDCINDDIAKLLASYSNDYYVCVELGLQTSNNDIGNFINRGYSSEDFTKAVNILNNYHIDTIAHIMIGLPYENNDILKDTVSFINSHNLQGIKIHSTYVVKNSRLADLYFDMLYTPITLEEYLDSLTYVLTHIDPKLIVHRISGDAPKDLLIAPEWNLHKKWVLNGIEKKLKEENLWQGKFYQTSKHI